MSFLKHVALTLMLSIPSYAQDYVQGFNYKFELDERTSNKDLLKRGDLYHEAENENKYHETQKANSEVGGFSFDIVDFDDDGTEDLMTSGNGLVYFHKGTGEIDRPYEPGKKLPIRLPFILGNGNSIKFIDIDKDGDLDILSTAGDDKIYVYRNLSK